MDIIIVGCGKVGSSLAEVLSGEHNVTIVDKKEALVSAASNDFDVMGIVGNCLQTEILEEANVAKANIFIAVTISSPVLSLKKWAHATALPVCAAPNSTSSWYSCVRNWV